MLNNPPNNIPLFVDSSPPVSGSSDFLRLFLFSWYHCFNLFIDFNNRCYYFALFHWFRRLLGSSLRVALVYQVQLVPLALAVLVFPARLALLVSVVLAFPAHSVLLVSVVLVFPARLVLLVSVVLAALYLLQSFVDLRFDRLLWKCIFYKVNAIVSAKLITWFIFICIFFNNFSVLIESVYMWHTVEVDINNVTAMFILRFVFFCIFFK